MTLTTTPGLPLAPIVYGAAVVATPSEVVDTLKSLMVAAGGLVTLASMTVMESPPTMASLSGMEIVPLASATPAATKCQPWVVSITSTPVTAVKLVGPAVSAKLTSPPAPSELEALKLTVYEAGAPATVVEGDTATALTELPNVIEFVRSVVPLPGSTSIWLA